ncbi:MAG: DNA-3-methyladenine glycosylase I [Chloroflexi bacterium]|nr:DNA-3-methyladenine glycosylase I [Chloroflexota bacterium]
MAVTRCAWVKQDDPLYVQYHDTEWGVPIRHDDTALFERICLEGAQAGLSWLTILRKREHYRVVFDGFAPAVVAAYDEHKIAALLGDPGIVRNRQKVEAAVNNAKRVLAIQDEVGSFADYLWGFVDGRTTQNQWAKRDDVPAITPVAAQMSQDLKRRGFKFVGPTICYAMMQAIGMVNDHTVDCFRHPEVAALAIPVGDRAG